MGEGAQVSQVEEDFPRPLIAKKKNHPAAPWHEAVFYRDEVDEKPVMWVNCTACGFNVCVTADDYPFKDLVEQWDDHRGWFDDI